MKTFSFLVALSAAACATEPTAHDESPIDTQSVPDPDGKSDDARVCGESSCAPRLCGYDCTQAGEQCTQTCAPAAGRDKAFVRATIGSVTVDSRDTPYSPVWDLDNVLIYGCDHWDFSSQTKDGLEIEIEQLRHSSFVVNPNDPTRHDHKLVVYVAPFTGPGSYRAEGLYAANERSTRFFARDACDVDVAASDDGGIHGTFSCRIPAQNGAAGAIDLAGEFGCPIDAMDPVFTRWTP